MSKLDDTRKKGMNTLIALAVIAVAVYVGFTPLYSLIGGGVAGAVVGSSFGAIFVIILTMYLLNKQTEIEQESKKSERVFDEKVKVYKQILETTKEIVEDGSISDQEISKLPFLMMELQMLGGDETISAYEKVFSTIIKEYDKEQESEEVAITDKRKSEIYKKMSEFSRSCRVDLGVTDRAINDDVFNRINGAIENSSKVTAKRRRSTNANYIDNREEFFKACEEKRPKEIIILAQKLHDALACEYSTEIESEKFVFDYAFTKDKATNPKISIKAAQTDKGALTRICTILIKNKELGIETIFKSPNFNYRQLKIGDVFFQHANVFWKESSLNLDNSNKTSILSAARNKYLAELKAGVANLDESTLKILLFAINESKKVVHDHKKLPRTELIASSEQGDNDSLEKLRQYIANDYIQELTLEEIENIALNGKEYE